MRSSRVGLKRLASGVGAVVLAGVLVGVAGCAAPVERVPSVVEFAPLVWENGVEPSSALEADPAVQFARTATYAIAYAWNHGDFTFSQLTDSFTKGEVENLYKSYIGQDIADQVNIYPGPVPWQPLSVSFDSKEDVTVIEVCGNVSPWLRYADRIDTTGRFFPEGATLGKIKVKTDSDGRMTQVRSDFGGGGFDRCDGSQVPVGFFDPQPVMPTSAVTSAPNPPLWVDPEDQDRR